MSPQAPTEESLDPGGSVDSEDLVSPTARTTLAGVCVLLVAVLCTCLLGRAARVDPAEALEREPGSPIQTFSLGRVGAIMWHGELLLGVDGVRHGPRPEGARGRWRGVQTDTQTDPQGCAPFRPHRQRGRSKTPRNP